MIFTKAKLVSNFLPWAVLLKKELESEKTKPTFVIYITFKTDILNVGLIFSIFNFFY